MNITHQFSMKNILILVLGFGLITSSCNNKNETEQPDEFQVIRPMVKDNNYDSEYVAEIQSVNHVEIRSRVKGFVEQIFVDEGQQVKQGQVLFTISYSEYENEYRKAIANYKNAIAGLKAAEVELENVKRLVEKDIISKTELEMTIAKMEASKADVEAASANKEQAHLYLSFSKVKAPFSGIINRIPNKAGSLVEEGMFLTSISDNKEAFAYFNLSESDYLTYLSNGEETKIVNLKLVNNSDYGHQGKIEIIESEFDRSTGNIAFRARFPNPEEILKHGANGKIVINKQIKNALLIPQKSTFEVQDKLYVYVLNKDSVLEQRNFTPKMRIPDFFLVESGLTGDDYILFEGVENVRDGQKILPSYIELSKSIPLQ
jgi:RND family efflux transporter MFP subunit